MKIIINGSESSGFIGHLVYILIGYHRSDMEEYTYWREDDITMELREIHVDVMN